MVKELDSLSWNSYDEEIGYDASLERSKSEVSQIEGAFVLQRAEQGEACPTFGNISISNGSDIHFGNKTFYQGPVTIKQFVVTDGDKLRKISEGEILTNVEDLDCERGVSNPCFDDDSAVGTESAQVSGSSVRGTVDNSSSRIGYIKDRLKKLLVHYRIPLVSICLFLVIILLSALILIQHLDPENRILKHDGDDSSKRLDDEDFHNTPIDGPIDPTKTKPLVLKMVSRLEWLAQPPSHPAEPLQTPVPYVIISHTATETCLSQAQCVFQVRYIQTFHLESRGWWDIGYNFLVGGDGEVYVGRGWDKQGAHTLGYNKYSIGISFVGTFIDNLPNENQILACKRLIEKGVELGYVKKDYKLLGARQLQTTQSPGTKLFEEIKTWPHWSKMP